MITEKLQKAFNDQIAIEMWSANLYLSMSFFLERQGLSGFASWLKKQSQEELDHAYLMAAFLHKRGGVAVVGEVAVVPNSWESPMAACENIYKHECHISKLIDKLLELAVEEKDNAAQDFLWSFVREQIEEEATAQGIIDKVKLAGASALLMLDEQLSKR